MTVKAFKVNDLESTNITASGDIQITNRMNVNGSVVFANNSFSPTEAALTITASNGVVQTPSNDGYMLHISGKQDVPSRIVFDSFGANTYGLVAGRTARGTVTAPSAVQANDVLMRVSGNGWGATQFAPLGIARMDILASENYTDAARGSRFEFWNVPIGANNLVKICSLNGDHVEFTGYVEPQKGFVYTPRNIPTPQTAVTIDYLQDSLVKVTIDNNITISHSNFYPGKVVEMWITNTSGSQRTVTHGVSATNSSDNSTTFNLPATSSAYLRFFSVDGDLANTFVATDHA